MRKWMLNIHLYGGLLCAPYLIIFGLSSLQFNHHFSFMTSKSEPVKWESPLELESMTNKDAMAESVRDSLGLMGWPLPWQTKRDADGDLEFNMERPGMSYSIHTDLKQHRARIESRSKGFWQVFNSLHALGSVPNSRFTPWWAWYTELCTAFVLFAAVSGIYLWINSKRERRIGMISLLAGLAASTGLMIYVIVRG
jgi:hypothetical protein